MVNGEQSWSQRMIGSESTVSIFPHTLRSALSALPQGQSKAGTFGPGVFTPVNELIVVYGILLAQHHSFFLLTLQ